MIVLHLQLTPTYPHCADLRTDAMFELTRNLLHEWNLLKIQAQPQMHARNQRHTPKLQLPAHQY